MQSSKLKTTLRESVWRLTDKNTLAVVQFGDDQERQTYLHEEIIKIINVLMAEVKL